MKKVKKRAFLTCRKNKIFSSRGDKRGLVWSEIAWWIIGLAVLVLIIVLILIFKGSGSDLLDKISNIFRFGK